MKNILKKIGVIGLIIAVLSPFIELPNVNAEENCSIHLQSYLFLDMANGGAAGSEGAFKHYAGSGYTTFANFPKVFPESDHIEILDYSINYVNKAEELKKYWTLYNMAMSSDNYYSGGTDSDNGKIFVTGETKDYVDNTILAHYVWAQESADGYEISEWDVTVPEGSSSNVMQGDGEKSAGFTTIDKDNVTIKPATFTGSEFKDNLSYTNLKSYFEYIANSEEETYVPLKITRKISDEEFDENTKETSSSESYYWPVVLNVEYQTCDSTSNEQWTLSYDGNVNDNSVTNIPSKQDAPIGTDIKVDSKKPSRNGYAFLKWCETENGNGKCYDPGETVVSPETSTTVTLYAQWGKGGTTDNEKTGVVSYVIGFISVGVVAGSIYFIAKKKNLFKQI